MRTIVFETSQTLFYAQQRGTALFGPWTVRYNLDRRTTITPHSQDLPTCHAQHKAAHCGTPTINQTEACYILGYTIQTQSKALECTRI